MEEKMMGGYGLIIFLILLFFIFNRGFGFGMGGNCGTDWFNGCGPSNCDIQKQELINTATTQFKVVDNARLVQDTVNAATAVTNNKIDFYAYQDLRDQLAQERNKNMVLENRIYSDGKFNDIEAKLAAISCAMVKQPPVYGAVGIQCSNVWPTGCGNSNSCSTPSLV